MKDWFEKYPEKGLVISSFLKCDLAQMKNAQTEQPAQTFAIFLAFYFGIFLSVLKQTFKKIMQTEHLRKLLLNYLLFLIK